MKTDERPERPARILVVAGARPNFVKVAPILTALKPRKKIETVFINTGQHHAPELSDVFFRDLGLPEPHANLEVGSESPNVQIAKILQGLDPLLAELRPDLAIVVGDVTSTLAAALAAAKREIPLAHVEAGLRSFDRTMPEETNRILTDHLSDLLFTTCDEGAVNLAREGISGERIRFVGNVMIDSLLSALPRARRCTVLETLGLSAKRYALVTLHRPSNVDDPESFGAWLAVLAEIARGLPVVFPVHPRTRGRIDGREIGDVRVIDPLGYLEFLRLMEQAAIVLTDSGGIQEETTVLGVPCVTLRSNTERPVTIRLGTNRLAGGSREAVLSAVDDVLAGRWQKGSIPPLWDGRTSVRIADALDEAWTGNGWRFEWAAPAEASRA